LNLVELRGEKSRAEIAEKLGITQQALGLIERGKRTPRPALMQKISNLYGISVGDLFFAAKETKSCNQPAREMTMQRKGANASESRP